MIMISCEVRLLGKKSAIGEIKINLKQSIVMLSITEKGLGKLQSCLCSSLFVKLNVQTLQVQLGTLLDFQLLRCRTEFSHLQLSANYQNVVFGV